MEYLTAISGKIETHSGKCFVGDQEVACPASPSRFAQSGFKLDIFPNIPSLDKRGDLVFTSIVVIILLIFSFLVAFKIKIFGKILAEYIKPIWYFILVSLAVVFWQYLFGLKTMDESLLPIRISQWIWEGVVLISAFKLSRSPGFGYGNMFFLGVLYSVVIHGAKAAVRYYFYNQTLLFALDRFVYGSLLVMVFAFVLGSVFVYLGRKNYSL